MKVENILGHLKCFRIQPETRSLNASREIYYYSFQNWVILCRLMVEFFSYFENAAKDLIFQQVNQ